MSFLNPADVTQYFDHFNPTKAIKARTAADAYRKGGAALRSGRVVGEAAKFYGGAKGDKFMADAGAYANQQAQNAQTFGTFANLAGGIGSFGIMGGFNNIGSSFGGGMTGSGVGQASLTPGVDVVPDIAPVMNPGVFQGFETPSFGPIMNA